MHLSSQQWQSLNRRIAVQTGLGKKWDFINQSKKGLEGWYKQVPALQVQSSQKTTKKLYSNLSHVKINKNTSLETVPPYSQFCPFVATLVEE
jgi:hypothetical protein